MTTPLSHKHDPDTSAGAVPSSTDRSKVKSAILHILTELHPGGATVPTIKAAYFQLARKKGWPSVQDYSIARRLSELHMTGEVFDTGMRRDGPNGRPVAVWARK